MTRESLRAQAREMAEAWVAQADRDWLDDPVSGLSSLLEQAQLSALRAFVEQTVRLGCYSCREYGAPRLDGGRWYHGASGGICQRQELWFLLSSLDPGASKETR